MFRLIGYIGALCLLACLAAPAAAFLPDDTVLQEELHERYGALSSWEAEMTFPAYPDVSVHLWYARGKWRQEWKSGDTAVAVGRSGNVVARCTDGVFAQSPLFFWMVPDPVATWTEWGVDNTIRSFGFCDDTPCLLLGADPGNETSTSVRLNNEDYSPILIRFMAGDSLISVQYGDYRTLGGFRVPQSVKVIMGAEHVLETRVRWLAVNRADDLELYDRDSINGEVCADPPPPFDLLRDAFQYPRSR